MLKKKIKSIQINWLLRIALTVFFSVIFFNTSCAEKKDVPLEPSISDEKSELIVNHAPSFSQEFRGKKLNVAVYEEAPFAFQSKETGVYKGICVDIWESIAHKNGITFTYTPVTKEEGLKGLSEKKYDLLLGGIPNFVQPDTMAFEFTTPFYISGVGLALAQKSLFKIVSSYFYSLTALKVFFSVALFIIIQGATIWFFEHKKNKDFKNSTLKGIGNGVWWSINVVSLSDIGDIVTKTLGGRIMATIWLFATLIIVNIFIGSLSSEFTVGKISSEIYNVKDIEDLNILCLDDSLSQKFLEENSISCKKITSIKDGLKAISEDKANALIYSEPLLRYMMKENPEKGVKFVPAGILSEYYSFMLPPNSPLLHWLNQRILELIKQQEIKKIVKKYLGSDYRCT